MSINIKQNFDITDTTLCLNSIYVAYLFPFCDWTDEIKVPNTTLNMLLNYIIDERLWLWGRGILIKTQEVTFFLIWVTTGFIYTFSWRYIPTFVPSLVCPWSFVLIYFQIFSFIFYTTKQSHDMKFLASLTYILYTSVSSPLIAHISFILRRRISKAYK